MGEDGEGGREGPVKSAKPRARKGLYGVYAPDVKSTKSEVKRAGITCKFSSKFSSPERGRQVKRNGLGERELDVHANLLIAAHIRICSLKFSVIKINAIIFGPP